VESLHAEDDGEVPEGRPPPRLEVADTRGSKQSSQLRDGVCDDDAPDPRYAFLLWKLDGILVLSACQNKCTMKHTTTISSPRYIQADGSGQSTPQI